jgi:hypothetical protein
LRNIPATTRLSRLSRWPIKIFFRQPEKSWQKAILATILNSSLTEKSGRKQEKPANNMNDSFINLSKY